MDKKMHIVKSIFKNYALLALLCFAISSYSSPSFADDMADAAAAATKFLQKLEQKKNADAWNSDMSDWFKERMTRDAFLANVTLIEAQLGGPGTGRRLIQQNKVPGMAGYTGSVYSYTFSTTFPAGNVYEMVALINENGVYRLSGMNFLPNPNK